MAILVRHVHPHLSLFPPSLTTALQEGKREKDDGMKRREEEQGGKKGRGE